MATYIKASLKRSYAESFLTELERNENQYFFFIANPLPWSNENSPPAYTDTVGSEYSVMNRVIGYKKITPENVFFALPRYEWESGSVYTQYDDSVELFSDSLANPLYVITDEYKVYKCLENNGGGVSTQKPTEVFSQPFALSDGYVWKYLATVRESDLPYELSDYVPIDYAYNTEDTEVSNQYNTQITSVSGDVWCGRKWSFCWCVSVFYFGTISRQTGNNHGIVTYQKASHNHRFCLTRTDW
jgi:hypothetical protein